MPRYFIEQAPDRFYQASELNAAKARARSISKRTYDGIYLIEEAYDPELMDYVQTGSIAYYSGIQDAREGTLAK